MKSLIRQIQLLLKEYLTSGDLAEAMRCVRDLEVPHFHHELVYEVNMMVSSTKWVTNLGAFKSFTTDRISLEVPGLQNQLQG